MRLSQRLAIALLVLLPAAMAGAAGLGNLRMQSSLGQPLVAEIDILNVSPQDASSLRVSLAPAAAYQADGRRYDQALKSLNLTLQHRADGAPYIKVRTRDTVTEPYLDVVVDLTWNGGNLRRAYAALLDLPTSGESTEAATRPPAAKAPSAAAATAAEGTEGHPKTARSSKSSRNARKSRRHRAVAQADTAAGVAAAQGAATPAAADKPIVPPAPRAPGSPLPAAPAKGARIVPPAPAKPAPPSPDVQAAGSADTAKSAAKPAVPALPGTAAADANKGTTTATAITDAAKAGTPATGSSKADTTAAVKSDTPSDASKGVGAAGTPVDGTKPPDAAGVAGTSGDAAKNEAKEAGKEAAAEPAAAPPVPPPPPPAAKKAPLPPPPAEDHSGVMDYLWLGLALLAVLLLLLFGWGWRRRQQAARREAEADAYDDEEPVIRPPVLKAVSPGGSPAVPSTEPSTAATRAVAATAAATASDMATASAAAAASSQTSMAGAMQSVDPIDEAKVYIEYGQHEQAEKVLREALSRQPGRADIQLLLLEQLAKLGDKDGFNKVAARLHKDTGGVGEQWRRVAALGYALDPQHLLYSPIDGAAGAPAPAGEAPAEAAGAPDSGGATPDLVKAFVGDVPAPAAAPAMTMVLPAASPTAATAPGGAATAAAGPMLPPLEFELPASPQPDPWGLSQDNAAPGTPDAAIAAPPARSVDALEFNVSLPDATQPPQPSPSPEPAGSSLPEAGLAFSPALPAIDMKAFAEGAAAAAVPAFVPAASEPPVAEAAAAELPTINMPIEATPESLEESGGSGESLPKINTNLDEEAADTAKRHDAHWEDVQQKFSLASAYLEISDKDGAMEVLREAEREGDAKQKAEARLMMQEIK